MRKPEPLTSRPAQQGIGQPGLLSQLQQFGPYFTQRPGLWVLVICSALVGAACEPIIPALMQPLLDKGFQQGGIPVWYVPASLLLLFGVRGCASYLTQVGLTSLSHHGLQALRQQMFSSLLAADLQLFRKSTASSLSNTVVFEAHQGATILVHALLSLLRNGLTLLALLAYLLYLNWKLTLIVGLVLPAVVWVMRTLAARVHQLTTATQRATDELAYVVEENVLAHRDIRLFSAQQQQQRRFDQLSAGLRKLAVLSTVAGAAMTPITQMLAALALSAVVSVALLQSSAAQTSVGGFVAFITAMLMMISPVRQLSEIAGSLTRSRVALQRAVALIEERPEEPGGTHAPARATGRITVENLIVRYPDHTAPALSVASLDIQPGQTVAFVGASGSGKTTLIHTLLRFQTQDAGGIALDGIDTRQWNLTHFRKQFGLVSQQVNLLNVSIAENIALGQSVEEHRVWECLELAHLADFVRSLPAQIHTPVGHNAGLLSGGQRQRLSIARALYRDAPILILDEATAALDQESERYVQQALAHLQRGRTTLVIAHRLASIRHADCIVVLDHGQILESGTHQELLARQGRYAHLCDPQVVQH
ncbi:ATP-binding cassette domain-containing protein [Candidatus Symbiobacter mobilis]|uniref:ATP-binding domain protein n=1 Tax=Candidatus Symbiobacter mobilis CR TaxID=946483 RepID=U5N819_9BURK|nr:ATP-binding cassette domain-containing protein [Candidatus Symbiobacter mobilis]AGX87706.1 ATP-binding domain protein [Candidatus Symbiobacter mobilis CR]